jgi:hypothetical protein
VAVCNKSTGSVECYEASSLSMLSVLSMELFYGMFWSYSTNRGLRPPTETLLRKPLSHKRGVGAKTSTGSYYAQHYEKVGVRR